MQSTINPDEIVDRARLLFAARHVHANCWDEVTENLGWWAKKQAWRREKRAFKKVLLAEKEAR